MGSMPDLPNILWLLSEDNSPLIGAYGDRLARTPNLDDLARRGIVYRNAFCTAPVSGSSRFAILTGIHAESCSPAINVRAQAHLPRFLRTYPELMRELGYYCTTTGNGDWNCDVSENRIFDARGKNAHWRNRPRGKPFLALFQSEATLESSLYGLRQQNGVVDPSEVKIPEYLPDTPDIRSDIACSYKAVERLDSEIGGLLKEVEDAGLSGNTIIFYCSVNGGSFPRGKRYLTDRGLRTALIACFPPKWKHLANAPPGTLVDTPVSLVDFAPTLLSLVGHKAPPEMQGTPFLGTFAGARSRAFGARNRIEERYDFVRAAMDGRYHYVRNYTPHRVFQQAALAWAAGTSYPSWEREFLEGRLNPVQARFFAGPREFEELYDLRTDPDQVNNLVAKDEYQGRLEAMRQALDDHMIDINDNGFIPEGGQPQGYLASLNQAAYPLIRLMTLSGKAARRDPHNLEEFVRLLSDRNALLRHWAILGIRMLGTHAASALEPLSKLMRSDPLEQNRVAAAEAVACKSAPQDAGVAVGILADLLDRGSCWEVKLQAINALTFIGLRAESALTSIRRSAENEHEYIRNAGRYLVAVLERRYAPDYPVVDIEMALSSHRVAPMRSRRNVRRRTA